MPKVSVVLPLFNGIQYIEESIQSVLAQTLEDWELLVVNDYDSNDGCADIVRRYAEKDPRIHLVQNETWLGLAESLNRGIQQASGIYIARVDVDDPSYPQRFEKQVAYLEKHPEVFLCGSLQRSVLPKRSYIQYVPTEGEELKAALLFGCEISHCSVMFRRDVFIKGGMKYDSQKLSEDYDLWTKIMFNHKLVNLPEVLVDHRWEFENISLEKGEALKLETREISARTLERFDIEVEEEDLILLSGWRSKPEEYAKYYTAQFLYKQAGLLKELYAKNSTLRLIEPEALKKIIWKRWNWVCECCGIFYQNILTDFFVKNELIPKVSIVLPVYQAVTTLRETIDSILVQDFRDWELLLIFEPDHTDGSFELANMYAFMDKRIRVIENHDFLGLADSINEGIRLSHTNYIARIDADDLANAKRIRTQYNYLEQHKDVGICQTYQHYFGSGANDFVHMPPTSAEEMKAKLLFFCDACHSTVMFRKDIFEKYDLFYSKDAALEDFDLWTRAVRYTEFVTIPEVYGEYRVGVRNISPGKMDEIRQNMCEIVRNQLKDQFNIDVPDEYLSVLNGWDNSFLSIDEQRRNTLLDYLQTLLNEIWNRNLRLKKYDKKALLQAIAAKWRWSKYNEPWQGSQPVSRIEEAIDLSSNRTIAESKERKSARGYGNHRIRNAIKKVIGIDRFWENMDSRFKYWSDEQQKQTRKLVEEQVENWTWERYVRTDSTLNKIQDQNVMLQTSMNEIVFKQNLIPYINGEKIRIVFLFQIASFWPSWESFYRECKNDSRLEVRFLLLDETSTEDVQMESARGFLEDSDIEYINYEEFNLDWFSPHIMVLQTPYDEWHRHQEHWSAVYKMRGIRLIYIPYGIEISDTEDSHLLHFHTSVIDNCWRIYTFSERMRQDYLKYAMNSSAVRVTGLPRFDSLFCKGDFVLDQSIANKCNGRKIVLWKLHFPKTIHEDGKEVTVTPSLEMYLNFARFIPEYSDLFFIFMPHPRFHSKKNSTTIQKMSKALFDMMSTCENVYIDERDDYRESLINADFIMIDRSAVMVEAGALGVPVLYLYNRDYCEPFAEAIRPLMQSYYQGSVVKDMQEFLEMCRNGLDPKKEEREHAFHECIPLFDGESGKRVKEDMIRDLENNVL